MMRNTPEDVMEASFDSAAIIAPRHGFEAAWGLRSLHHHDYVIHRTPRFNDLSLTEADMGPENPNIKMSDDGWLELRDKMLLALLPDLF